MLQTNPAVSSIQRRRILHRRQQSLETPILAQHILQTPRRSNSTRQRTGRNHSIDLGVVAGTSIAGHQYSTVLDANRLTTGPPLARIQEPAIQLTTIPEQHFVKQETQEQSLARPGIPQPVPHTNQSTFHTHVQQCMSGVSPTTANQMHDEQAAAMQSLQSHLIWYQQKFGGMNAVQPPPVNPSTYSITGDLSLAGMIPQPQLQIGANRAMSQHVSQTVPNTPQQPRRASPPPSHVKHSRSQSYQLDTAPMPSLQEQPAALQSCGNVDSLNYTASSYSTTNTDVSSPLHRHASPLPTLFEDAAMMRSSAQEDLLLQAMTDDSDPDFNDPHFVVGGMTPCPEQAALDAAGIDATYIDTGISEEVLNSWLVSPKDKGDPYLCKFQGCGAAINRKENARSHVQNHLDDRRFQCNPCGKRFSRMHDTKRHFLTHTQERPAVCPCGKTFARADALTRHRQRDMCTGVLPGFEKNDEDRPKRGRPKKDKSLDESDRGKQQVSRRNTLTKRTTRPDLDSRIRKANLARTLDHVDSAHSHHSASPSDTSDMSMPDTPPHDHDMMNATEFLNLEGAHDQFNSATSTWLDTPPTSPPSFSPIKNSHPQTYADLSTDRSVSVVSPAQLSRHSSPHITTANLPSHANTPQEVMEQIEAILSAHNSPVPVDIRHGFQGESSPFNGDGQDAFDFSIIGTQPNITHDPFSPGGSDSGSSSYHSDYDALYVNNPEIRGKEKTSLGVMLHHANSTRLANDMTDDFEEIFGHSQQPEQYGDICDMLDAWISAN